MASATTSSPVGGAVTSGAEPSQAEVDRLVGAVAAVERHSLWALSAMMVLAGVLLVYMGRGLSFFYDDWDFVTHDYGGGLHSLLAAHVGNISIFPIAIYKLLFHLVGLNHYAVFRLVVVALHLICGGLVFVLAARRIARAPALLAAALILFLGAAWEDLLWAFQVGYMLSVAGGLAAWVLMERRGLKSQIGAMLCVVVAAGSSSLGIAVMIGVLAELVWSRRWSSLWVVVLPAFLYCIWYLGYGESQVTGNSLINAPGFAEDLAAAAFGGIIGRALEWGRPLALAGALCIFWRLTRPLPVSPRLVGLLAAGLGLWAITAVARSTISQPEASRYIYLGAVVIVLTGVEVLRDVTITPRATVFAAVIVGVCAVTGLTVLRAGAMGLRSNSKAVTAELGALELAAAYAPPGYQPDAQRAPQITAGPYLHTVRAVGSSPADSPADIAAAEPALRAIADGVLMALEAPLLTPTTAAHISGSAPAPTLTSVASVTQVQHGSCVDLRPLSGATITGTVLVPKSGLAIDDEGPAPASLALRRFGEIYLPLTSAVASHQIAKLVIPPDRASNVWYLQVASASSLALCAVSQ
jgi:hypothetical protein